MELFRFGKVWWQPVFHGASAVCNQNEIIGNRRRSHIKWHTTRAQTQRLIHPIILRGERRRWDAGRRRRRCYIYTRMTFNGDWELKSRPSDNEILLKPTRTERGEKNNNIIIITIRLIRHKNSNTQFEFVRKFFFFSLALQSASAIFTHCRVQQIAWVLLQKLDGF